ncbi:DUF4190 domain-containing protein [Candidatus Soleaferrea massiliensis]|uniref:DUF4190 domain-containing protein n=1 Tax=Candidatus Soleaferrea massiliensis TaxID=1470354 RepID=UPI00058C3BA8|nr:DUF4190 domain-containing protein [Candidatus Soleaferrea massiliensis]
MYSAFDQFIVYGQAVASLLLFVALVVGTIVGIVLLIKGIKALNVYIAKNTPKNNFQPVQDPNPVFFDKFADEKPADNTFADEKKDESNPE